MSSSRPSLQQFLEALSNHFGQPVTRDTWLWKDLNLFGDDYWFGLVPVILGLGASVRESDRVRLGDFLPEEREIGLFGRLVARRTIPDITAGEFYAFLEFKTAP
ncbi:MAG: hypothetical protein Q8R82_21930 [Hyphomonadaceae bacterium]|nr:hypothetical protein [Hyphomonadaceae bacterium]